MTAALEAEKDDAAARLAAVELLLTGKDYWTKAGRESLEAKKKSLEMYLVELNRVAKELAPWQQRVVAERKELITRLTALQGMLRSSPPNAAVVAMSREDLSLLEDQAAIMYSYLEVLNARVRRF